MTAGPKRPPSALGRWLRFLALVWKPEAWNRGRDLVRERQTIRGIASARHTLNHWKG